MSKFREINWKHCSSKSRQRWKVDCYVTDNVINRSLV